MVRQRKCYRKVHRLADFLHAGKKAGVESPNADISTERKSIGDLEIKGICMADVVRRGQTTNDEVPSAVMAEDTVRKVEIHLSKRNKKDINRNKRKRHTREEAR